MGSLVALSPPCRPFTGTRACSACCGSACFGSGITKAATASEPAVWQLVCLWGCFPFFGLQIVLGVALASLVRGNHILAAAGTWISNPLTYVPLYWFNYQLGCMLLGPGPALPSLPQLRRLPIWELGLAMGGRLMLGSALVGLVSAALLGGSYWLVLEQRQRRAHS